MRFCPPTASRARSPIRNPVGVPSRVRSSWLATKPTWAPRMRVVVKRSLSAGRIASHCVGARIRCASEPSPGGSSTLGFLAAFRYAQNPINAGRPATRDHPTQAAANESTCWPAWLSAGRIRPAPCGRPHYAPGMDFRLSAEQEQFRADVRGFLAETLTDEFWAFRARTASPIGRRSSAGRRPSAGGSASPGPRSTAGKARALSSR